MTNYEKELEERRIQQEINLPKLIAILKEHGIEMNVGGCGCCDSPWVAAWYKGEKIVDAQSASFDMVDLDKEKNSV
jgi:hypothetical protein